jgi:hypothetical protein
VTINVEKMGLLGKRVSVWHDQSLLVLGEVVGEIEHAHLLAVKLDRGVVAFVDLTSANVLTLEEPVPAPEGAMAPPVGRVLS